MQASTGGLAGELKKLLAVVHDNHSELESHIKSSESFFQKAADQQVISFLLCIGLKPRWARTSRALLVGEERITLDRMHMACSCPDICRRL